MQPSSIPYRICVLCNIFGVFEMSYQDSPLPLVTIGIPCYNEDAFIGRALSSALDQTYPNIEVVISDAGSQDRTPEFLKQAELQRNVHILYHKQGTTKYDNWSAMIEASHGEYILILLSKHILYADGISKLVKPFIQNPKKGLAYVRGCMVSRLSDGTKPNYIPAEMTSLSDSRVELQRLLLGNTCETIATLYHLDKLRQSLPFDTNFERTFVWLQNARLASLWPVYFVNTDVAEWIKNETPEQIALKHRKALDEIPALFERFCTLCSFVGLKIDIFRYRDRCIARANAAPKASIRNDVIMKCKTHLPRPFKILAKQVVFRAKQVVFRGLPAILGRYG